jgi:hypothetical protein
VSLGNSDRRKRRMALFFVKYFEVLTMGLIGAASSNL